MLFALAGLGFVASALVHLASFFGFTLGRTPWVLHLGMMALAMTIIIKGAIVRAPRWPPGAYMRVMLREAPPFGERAYQLLFLNFLAHFGALIAIDRGIVPGDRMWWIRGQQARMFSAGWMLVYSLCALTWWPAGPSPRDDGSSGLNAE